MRKYAHYQLTPHSQQQHNTTQSYNLTHVTPPTSNKQQNELDFTYTNNFLQVNAGGSHNSHHYQQQQQTRGQETREIAPQSKARKTYIFTFPFRFRFFLLFL